MSFLMRWGSRSSRDPVRAGDRCHDKEVEALTGPVEAPDGEGP